MTSLPPRDEEILTSQSLKRKRSDDFSNDGISNPEEDTREKISKCVDEAAEEITTPESSVTDPDTKTPDKSPSRKRKYIFNTDGNAPKRGRFYYLNESKTKPRRPKIIKTLEGPEKKSEIVPGRKHKFHFAKSDNNGNLYLAHRLYHKSDLFFNDEKKCNYESFKKLDLAYHVVDEIALEGLDGITIEAFWKRLRNVFPNNINKAMADRIWRLICNNKRINFYILKEPREELIFFDRCKYMDIDSSMFVEPFIEFNDIYPLLPVTGVDGGQIRGSCSTFNTRKENNGVRKFSMDKAIKLYNQKLVFVADQSLRNKALINEEADPNIELLDVEYCMLEKIGRSRDQGEFTQGKISLINDTKRVYHHRKVLSQLSLIEHQTFSFKFCALQQNITGSVVHLSRFYHKRKTKQIAIMERFSQILKTKPNYQMEIRDFKKTFGQNISLVKLLKTAEFRKFFKISILPYRKFYPNAKKHEYLNKNKMKERQVRIIRMLDPHANITALMDSKDTKETLGEKKSDSPGHRSINYEYLRDVFLYIISSGQVGVTIQEINDYFKTDYYSVRMAVRKLLMRNVIKSTKIDLGRQQSMKFSAKCFSIPGCHIQTQPKTCQLTEETLNRVLKCYDNINDDLVEFYSKTETPKTPVPALIQFKLSFEPFCCTSFLTETLDPCSDELTIYDIVIKGRDKLLLIESNLFAHYLSEWDDFLLKHDDFSKELQLLQNGFGKVIYDFLTTIRLAEKFQTDNHIIFNLNNVTSDTKISRQVQTHRVINIGKHSPNLHSDNYHIDTIAKIYLFEAMFNEFHKNNTCIEKLKQIHERVMVFDGKTRRGEVAKPEIKAEIEVSSSVGMEKFMGPSPTMEWCEREDDITIEIFASTKPVEVMQPGALFQADDDDVILTQRYVNRANIILTNVYTKKIVQDVTTIYKDILKEEGEEGYDKKACKKSIVSIISKLVEDGYIKCYKVVMTGKNITRTHCFICVHETDVRNDLIRSTIEQIKLKFYSSGTTQKTITIKKKIECPFNSVDVKQSIIELKKLTAVKGEVNLKFDKAKGKAYGYAPKFQRMRVLHEHLFYVIREATECEPLSARQLFDLCKKLRIKLSQNEITEMPPIYRNEVSWKMFIPSLSRHATWPKGWALACDIVLRMPLSVFIKLCNICYEVAELESYLEHPIKRHYLIKHLPASLRNILLYRRKYFYNIYETISNLCYIGLMQLGPRNSKEKDQMFMYLNSKASLYDTCNSKPGYHQVEDKKYKKIPFDFKTANDIEIYWSEVLRICMNTPLGKRKILDGQLITIEECSAKPAMVETLKAKEFKEAIENDTGTIPGDHRGSAGFDSSIWSFIKRNWLWNSRVSSAKTAGLIQAEVTGLNKEKLDVALPAPVPYSLVAETVTSERKVRPKTKKKVKTSEVKKLSKKKIVRKIVSGKKKKKIREYCDATDKAIMKKNPGLRVEWDEEEDQLLRYCRTVSVFLCPEFKKQFVPYNILRDVVHRIYPKSKNKTARAIQRRIYLMLTNDEVMKIMESNTENLLNSDTICKYFEQIHCRHKNHVKISDSQLYIAFIYLMSYICRHRKEIELLLLGCFASFDFFSDDNIREFEPVLQNCDDSNNAPIYTNPKTVEDITKDTIKSVVHCSMSCRKDSVGWTFHLSSIYRKFQDDLIRIVVSELKKDQILVRFRSLEGKTLDNAWPIPIKFSYSYNMMKTTSYTRDIYLEAYRHFVSAIAQTCSEEVTFVDCNELNSFWEQTRIVFDIPEMGIILNPEIEDHGEVIEELAKRFRIYLEQICRKTKNKSELSKDKENANSDKNVDEIKDEVRHLVFRVPYLLEGNLETCFKNMLDSDNNLEINNYIFLMIVDLKKFAQDSSATETLKRFVDAVEEHGCSDDYQKLLKNLAKVVFAIQSIHHVSEGQESSLDDAFVSWEKEIWDEVRIKKDEKVSHKALFNKNYASGMESCIKRAQDGDYPTLDEIKEGIMAETGNSEERKIPHITDLIMLLNEDRFPELDTDVEAIEKMKDHFIMQYPKLSQFLIDDLDTMRELEMTKKIMDDSKLEQVKWKTENVVKVPQLDKIVSYIQLHNGTQEDISVTENLIDFIKEKREMGASAKELKAIFVDQISLNLVELMQFLTDLNVILRTGVASIVYVYHEYQTEWLIETFMLTSSEQQVFELSQKQEINKNLKAVLGERIQSSEPRKVQLKPWTKLDGCVNNKVFQEWLCIILSRCADFPNIPFLVLCEQFHYIKPVDIYFLVEVLEELGCVEIYLLENVENSLFSSRGIVNECKATCLDSFEEIFVKPTNVAGLCFGSFLEKDILV